MTAKRDSRPTENREIAGAISAAVRPLEARIERIEAEIFPKRGPSGGFGARLEDLTARLAAVEQDLGAKVTSLDQKYDKKIRDLIRIVAELRDLVASLQSSRAVHVRTMEAGA